MRVNLNLERAELRALFRTQVVEYFNHLYPMGDYERVTDHEGSTYMAAPKRGDQRGFDRKVDLYVDHQFKYVEDHLCGKIIGAEASDLTCAFMTSMQMKLQGPDRPYWRMQPEERLVKLYAFYFREHGPMCNIRIDYGHTRHGEVSVYLGSSYDAAAISMPISHLAEWMDNNVPYEG